MTTLFKYVQAQNFALAGAGAIAGATTLILKSFKAIDGVTNLTMTDFGDIGFATIEPGNGTQEEQISFTGVTQNANGTATLTGVKTVLFVNPYTATSGLAKTHPGSATFIITNTAGFYDKFAAKANDEVITGYWEGPDPLTPQGYVTNAYMLALINGGSVSTNALIEVGTAGETVAAGNLVYLKASDGRWWLCDADTATTVENVQLGIAQGAGTAGVNITGGVLRRGLDSNQSGGSTGLAYAGNTAGAIVTSTGTTERVIGEFVSATEVIFDPFFYYLMTAKIKAAAQGGSTFGTPSSTNKFITQDYLSSATGLPVRRVYGLMFGANSTRFDITNPSGTTFRYTWDGTGTDPGITALTAPIGYKVNIWSTAMSAANTGSFTITGSGANYFEVTNASGVAENDKVLSNDPESPGYLQIYNPTWTKPAGLKYVDVEVVGGGGGGGGNTTISEIGAGGGGGGYAKKIIAVASLGATETVTVGGGGAGGVASGGTGSTGATSSFGALLTATGGVGGTTNDAGGIGGVGTLGDIILAGGIGTNGGAITAFGTGIGGGSFYASHSSTTNNAQASGLLWGGGGSGGSSSAGGDTLGGHGGAGVVIITEYYS